MEEVAGNILKHSLQNKYLQSPFIIDYDFETTFADTNGPSKPGELKKIQKSPSL